LISTPARNYSSWVAPPQRSPALQRSIIAATKDATGAPLQGGKTYHLRVPPNVTAKQFWAVTVYGLETAAFIREAARAELNSYNEEMQKNPDGWVDVYFGVTAPMDKESNWIATATGKPWIALFRFDGPAKALFDKTWKLPDIEQAATGQAASAA